MPASRKMPQGFAHPLLLLVMLVAVGIGVAVFAGSTNLLGRVLGAKNQSDSSSLHKTTGIKVVIISPKSSWTLTEYLCVTQAQCQTSPTAGKWWATVSGAPTTQDGHEVFIEPADGWKGYSFVRLGVKAANGVVYSLLNDSQTVAIVGTAGSLETLTFIEPDAGTN